MEMPVAALLRIVQETSNTYRVLYLRRSESGATAMPWHIYGHDTLRLFLQQFEPLRNIEVILTRVGAGGEVVLDLGFVDEERVARVLRQYTHGSIPIDWWTPSTVARPSSRSHQPPHRH
jgi:hypothetical protein